MKRFEEDKEAEDSGEDTSGSEDINSKFLFRSALDVGSRYIKVIPDDDDLIFYNCRNGRMEAKVYLENTVPKAPVAFCAWTSNKGSIKIEPEYGFIRPGSYQYITFSFNINEVDKVNNRFYRQILNLN